LSCNRNEHRTEKGDRNQHATFLRSDIPFARIIIFRAGGSEQSAGRGTRPVGLANSCDAA